MTTNYIPLDKDKHSALKVNLKHNYKFAHNAHVAATTMREFGAVGSCMPIVFVKEPSQGRFHTVAMLGLDQGSNLFFQNDKWLAHALPLSIQRYPFDVRPDGDKLGVYIDENAEVFGDEGEPLFTEEGEPTDYLKSRNQMLGDIANSEMSTQKFVTELQELNLIDEVQLTITYATGQKRNVTGLNIISEQRLNELSDEKTLELKKSGFLAAAYAMLMSLGQLNRLVQLSADSAQPIVNIQVASPTEETAKAS